MPGRAGQGASHEGRPSLGPDSDLGQQLPSQFHPPGGRSGAYLTVTVMAQVIAPNEERDQLPVFL